MPNRIIVATLYQTQGTSPIYFLNVSPRKLKTINSGDKVFLTVNLDTSVPTGGGPISCSIVWPNHDNPFTEILPTPLLGPTAPNTPTLIGTLLSGEKQVRYTLSILYAGKTFEEDPEMQINS